MLPKKKTTSCSRISQDHVSANKNNNCQCFQHQIPSLWLNLYVNSWHIRFISSVTFCCDNKTKSNLADWNLQKAIKLNTISISLISPMTICLFTTIVDIENINTFQYLTTLFQRNALILYVCSKILGAHICDIAAVSSFKTTIKKEILNFKILLSCLKHIPDVP